MFAWVAAERALSAAALTVRAQAISLNDGNTLLWDQFFPRRNVDSVKVRNITQIDFRPVSDRREWNARGRQIPLRTPNIGDIEMIPIEAYFKIAEREIQELTERTLGNQQLFRQIVGASIPERVDSLALANARRIEIDAMMAWATGTIVARNPVTGETQTAEFDFDSAAERYRTAPTAWDDAGVNAYDLFLAWLYDAIDLVGPVKGVQLRLATLSAIRADAPQIAALAGTAVTRSQLEQRISDEIASPFRFYVNENTQDVFNDGGLATTRTKVWPAQVVAAIPNDGNIGYTAFAPVARAWDISRAVPEAEVDVRGQTAYTETENGGRTLNTECQVNALPIPEESKVAVIDAGV